MNFLHKIAIFFACLLLACLPLPQFAGEGGLGLGSLAALFVLAAFADQLFSFWPFKQTNFKAIISALKANLTKIDLAVWALILSAFVATISSYFFKQSLFGFAKYFLYFLVYVAFCFTVKSKNDVYLLVGAALVGLLWTNIEGVKQVFVGAEELATWEDPNLHGSEHLNRIYSTLLNPNLLSAYLLALWPLCLLCLNFFGKQKSTIKNLLGLIGLVFGLLTIYLTLQTGSRAAWIALMVQLFILAAALFIYTRSRLILGGFLLALSGAVFYVLAKPSFLNRVLSIFISYDHSSNSFRLHVWKACLHMIADNPIFGVGVGSKVFYLAYGIYMDAKYSALGAYSLFLETAVEMGLIGLAALLALIYFIGEAGGTSFKKLLKVNKPGVQTSEESKENIIATLVLLLGLAGLLADSFFDIVILRPQVQIILWMLVALLRYYKLIIKN
jgi:putative inorganic carbon (hco3(-)) transporter